MINLKSLVVATATTLFFLCIGLSLPSVAPPSTDQEKLTMSAAELQAYGSVSVFFPNFDFAVECRVESYQVVRVAKRSDPVILQNQGLYFSNEVERIIQQAQPGDMYFFEDIRTRCPGDYSARALPAIVIEIR